MFVRTWRCAAARVGRLVVVVRRALVSDSKMVRFQDVRGREKRARVEDERSEGGASCVRGALGEGGVCRRLGVGVSVR